MEGQAITIEFIQEVVKSYVEYALARQGPSKGDDLRLGLHAAGVIAHFRESLPKPYFDPTWLTKQCPDWDLLNHVVNASKHKVRTSPNAPFPRKENIVAVEVQTDYQDAAGIYKHFTYEVDAFYRDGTYVDVFVLMTNVMNYWFTVLVDLDLLPESHTYTVPRLGYVSRREAHPQAPNPPISPYMSLMTVMRQQRFNYLTSMVEPYRDDEFQMTGLLMEYDKQRNLKTFMWTNGVEPPGGYITQKLEKVD